jgi:hypothetical protein
MREVMERILEVKRKLDQHDDALDVLASLRLHASDAYQTLQRACFAMCDEVDLLESRLWSLFGRVTQKRPADFHLRGDFGPLWAETPRLSGWGEFLATLDRNSPMRRRKRHKGDHGHGAAIQGGL